MKWEIVEKHDGEIIRKKAGVGGASYTKSLTERQWRTEGRLLGGFKPSPKFRSFDKVEKDCKLSGKCLVFLFQHPN